MTAIRAPWGLLDHSGEIEDIEETRIICGGYDSLLVAHVKGIDVRAISIFWPYAHHLHRIVSKNLEFESVRITSINSIFRAICFMA